MWLQLILSMLGLGLIDALNPYTVAVLLILLPLVNKKWHSSLFIWGTYFTYVTIAILLYFGVAQILGTLLGEWLRTHQTIVGVVQLLCAGLSIAGLAWWTLHWYQNVGLAGESPDLARKPKVLKSPWFILGLAIISTLYDSPSALPLFWFLGMLTQVGIEASQAVPLLIVYCFIYILPMIVLYVLYDRMTGQTFKKFEQRFQAIVRRVTYYSIPVFLFALCVWMVWDGWARLE